LIFSRFIPLSVAGFLSLSLLFPTTVFPMPLDGQSLFEHYCAVCHGKGGKGNGINAEHLDPAPADLTDSEVAALSEDEIVEVIKKGGAGVELSIAMPPWGNTLSDEEIQSVVSYIRILQKGPSPPRELRLSSLQEGEAKCPACHANKKTRQIAPDLSHEGSKFYRTWLHQFLKNPDRIRPLGFIPLTKTKMPDFNFSDEDVDAVTEYLMTLKEDRFSGKGAQLDLSDSAVKEGQALFDDIYGCFGCHKTSPTGPGGIVGPNLSTAANRLKPGWIAVWLKDPESVRPDSPMPNFGLSGQEIQYLMAYILSLGPNGKDDALDATPSQSALVKKGEELVSKKNCTFCHLLDTKKGLSHSDDLVKEVVSVQSQSK